MEAAGGHFWNESLVNSDPWTAVQYNTDNETSLQEEGVRIISGLEAEEIVGHAVIVHDSVAPGRRIACAIITEMHTSTTTTAKPDTPTGGNTWLWIVFSGVAIIAVVIGIAGCCFLSQKSGESFP